MQTPPIETWYQFSLYPPGCRNFVAPQQALRGFLPDFLASCELFRWHFLFEPSALVRFQTGDHRRALKIARELATKYGLEFEEGDAQADINPDLAWPGLNYGGEASFYGPELWTANANFMQAASELSLEISKITDPERQLFMVRKFLHLYLNTLGLNYLEETALLRNYIRRLELELIPKYFRT